ncbi:hypothetical protein OUZ56_029139 [Daphnia magna]|uniref:Uncharacterized protein n=1 Tax=Daphnia magna TaxID=35525 RepID=A0ABR0B5Z3_9CRUS|nr:hypothetical protein OUZ56_029139 [Daphnia magna]
MSLDHQKVQLHLVHLNSTRQSTTDSPGRVQGSGSGPSNHKLGVPSLVQHGPSPIYQHCRCRTVAAVQCLLPL